MQAFTFKLIELCSVYSE